MIQKKNYYISTQGKLTNRKEEVWIFLSLLFFMLVTFMSSIRMVMIIGGIGIILISIRNILVFFEKRREEKIQIMPSTCKKGELTCQSGNYEGLLPENLSFSDRLKYHNFSNRLFIFNRRLKRENLTNDEFTLLLDDVFDHKLK